MKQLLLNDTYPVNVRTIDKQTCDYKDVDALIGRLKENIDRHPVATYIGEFDHTAHTRTLEDHRIGDGIQEAKIVIFCFGKELPKAEMAAVRPRSIAVVECVNEFVVSFMDAPNPNANDTMIEWVKAL